MANAIRLAAILCACLVLVSAARAADAPPSDVKMIASFEKDSPFVHVPITLEFPDMEKQPPDTKAEIVSDHATDGQKALKIHNGSLSLAGPLDWSGYDYLKVDIFSDSKEPKLFMLLLEDDRTQGHHWWQGQVFGAIMPGKNTLVLPIACLRGGGKGRPYKLLEMNKLKLASFKIFKGDIWSCDYTDNDAMYLDNIRLENDTDAKAVVFPGLAAYDVSTDFSPLMPGFKRLGPSDIYNKDKGFGMLEGSQTVGPPENKHSIDFMRPDPLYASMIPVTKGGFAFDLPNGKYHVFMNLDFGGGFWGETQAYHERKVTANGKVVVDDKMDFAQFKDRYFSHYDIEDWPGLDVWEKYIKPCYHEKEFDVDVENGQLKLECQSDGLGCAVSAIVIYPADKADQGAKFLKWVEAKRKWWFQNENKEVTHTPTGKDFAASSEDQKRGIALFSRDLNSDVYFNDKPDAGETVGKLQDQGFKGQSIPMNLCVVPFKDMGKVTVTVGDLAGESGAKNPASSFEVGYVSYRISRTVYEGTMYTMAPRYIRLENSIAMPTDITRRFWVRANLPAGATPGLYKGKVTLATEKAGTIEVPVEITVLHGSLDAADMPMGPFNHSIGIPWFGNDPQAAAWNTKLTEASLRLIHDAGFTSFSGMPVITYNGFKDGKPQFDFSVADGQMMMARSIGFKMPILSYCGFGGMTIYAQDLPAMKAAGFTDYSEFIKAVFSAVQKHADENNWLPVYFVLGDEPAGKEDILAATENANAYRKAFPSGPPWFTLCGSCVASDPDDPGIQLAKAFHAIAWNVESEASVNALHKLGGQWGLYNWTSRWGFGDHFYKSVKQFGCKFLISWHWNAAGGDPYFGLDTREDDYCWVNSTPDGRLMPRQDFERVREGIVDYRCLITLDRLAREKASTPAGKEGQELIKNRMDSFKLDNRDGLNDYKAFRKKVVEAIDKINTAQ